MIQNTGKGGVRGLILLAVSLGCIVCPQARADTDISVAEASVDATVDQGQTAQRWLTLQVPVGSNAVHYSAIAQLTGGPRGATPRSVPTAKPKTVRPLTAVDWQAAHVPGRLIVCFDGQGVVLRGGVFAALPAQRAARDAVHARVGGHRIKSIPLINADVIKAPGGVSLQELAEQYRSLPGVTHVQPDYIVSLGAFPDDPHMPQVPSSLGAPDDQTLWGLHTAALDGVSVRGDVLFDMDIDAAEAWEISTGSNQVIVAVIDTGVDYDHPDIADNMWVNPGEVAGNGLDDDGNGLVDDVYGYDFINEDGDPQDDNGHGTHVAGTIGAVGGNQTLIAGVAWDVRIMALKFLGANGYGSTSDAAQCLDYAVQMGATLSNNSWGGGAYNEVMRTAIENAGAAGHLFVAAAGNSGRNTDLAKYYPQGYDLPNIVSVGALDKDGDLAGFSNYGSLSVDLAAPGVDVVSLQPGGGLTSKQGTSMASPHVCGVAALLKSVRSDATPEALKAWLLGGVTPTAGLGGLVATGGRLSAYDSLRLTLTPWITFSDREGILPAGNQIGVELTFDGFGVEAGTYSGVLRVLDLSYDNRATPVTEVPFTFIVNYVPGPPLAEDISAFAQDDSFVNIELLGSDPNPGDTLTYRIESLPTTGSLTDPATGLPIASVPYTLADDVVRYDGANGGSDYADSFTYTVSDGTASSSVATVGVDVYVDPAAPTNLVAVNTVNTGVDLSWDAVPSPTVAGYNVFWAEYPEGPWFQSNGALVTNTTYRWYAPWEGDWSFRVTAVNLIGGESGFSDTATTFVNFFYTADPLVVSAGDGYVDLEQWSGADGLNVTSRIYRATDRYGPYSLIDWVGAPPYRDETVTNGLTYHYIVGLYDEWDSYEVGNSRPAEATPSAGMAAPENVEIDWYGDGQLNLTWDERSGVYGYRVMRSNTHGGPYGEVSVVLFGAEYLDSGLTNWVTYYYVVQEVDAGLVGGPLSAEVSGAPYDPAGQPPAPDGLFFDEVVEDSITVEWDPIGSVTGYRVYRAGVPAGPYVEIGYVQDFNYDDGDVSPGTQYCYRVSAVSLTDIEGPQSGEICATTLLPWVRGDVDCDADVDVEDVPYFVLALIDPAAFDLTNPGCDIARADMNDDDLFDGQDIQLFVDAALTP